jgi:transcriptional regulator with XRE-family HTH domain
MVGNSLGGYELPFGAALRRLRRAAGMSQEQLGLEAGVQRNFISLIETGQNQPTINTITRLARALGLKASELVAEAERESHAGPKTRRRTGI